MIPPPEKCVCLPPLGVVIHQTAVQQNLRFIRRQAADVGQQIVDAALAEPEAAADVDAQRPAGEAASDLMELELAGDCLEVSSGAHA